MEDHEWLWLPVLALKEWDEVGSEESGMLIFSLDLVSVARRKKNITGGGYWFFILERRVEWRVEKACWYCEDFVRIQRRWVVLEESNTDLTAWHCLALESKADNIIPLNAHFGLSCLISQKKQSRNISSSRHRFRNYGLEIHEESWRDMSESNASPRPTRRILINWRGKAQWSCRRITLFASRFG
jgi:hypothetical protein